MSATLTELVLMLAAGTAAGIVGTAAGLASLVSYPALLAAGLTPLSANVTNSVALVLSGVGATAASKEELSGQSGRVRRFLTASVCGGTTGAVLLLFTPPGAFALIVPWLVACSSLLLLARPLLPSRPAGAPGGHRPALTLSVFAIAVYGGYFGAAAGVLMLAVLALGLTEDLLRLNALKNVVLGAANAVAALGFAVFGPVDWPAAVPLALGSLLGGWAGPRMARRIPVTALRWGIGIAGLGLAARLWTTAAG
jgi:uncharacterized membrane protein YfcA